MYEVLDWIGLIWDRDHFQTFQMKALEDYQLIKEYDPWMLVDNIVYTGYQYTLWAIKVDIKELCSGSQFNLLPCNKDIDPSLFHSKSSECLTFHKYNCLHYTDFPIKDSQYQFSRDTSKDEIPAASCIIDFPYNNVTSNGLSLIHFGPAYLRSLISATACSTKVFSHLKTRLEHKL